MYVKDGAHLSSDSEMSKSEGDNSAVASGDTLHDTSNATQNFLSLVSEYYDVSVQHSFFPMPINESQIKPFVVEEEIQNCSSASDVFRLFFDDQVIERLADSTNSYASKQRSAVQNKNLNQTSRAWKPVTEAELIFFIGSLISMGVVCIGDKRDYFSSDTLTGFPSHHALKGMSLTRWEQIKRFFHVENPEQEVVDHASGLIEDLRFYGKVQWLVEKIEEKCSSLVDPGSVLSYDEAMIRFMGRSSNTIQASHKPIKQGYKAMVLATPGNLHGYVHSFYLRRTDGIVEGPASEYVIADERLKKALALSLTNKLMIFLADRVPKTIRASTRDRNLIINADNRFWNVPTMSLLRKLGIGGCGTFRSNAKGQSGEIRKEIEQKAKNLKSFKWGDIQSWVVTPCFEDGDREEIPDSSVLLVSWIDGNAVKIMSSIRSVKSRRFDFCIRKRRRPKQSSSNAQANRLPFGSLNEKFLPIPKIIHDYNMNMNDVDSFDQRRSAFDVRLRSRKNWLAIFQFLLDISLVNTIAITRMKKWEASPTTTGRIRMKIANDLLNYARTSMETSTQTVRTETNITGNAEALHGNRLSMKLHLPVVSKERHYCFLCRYKLINNANVRARERNFFKCSECNLYLCLNEQRNCFHEYQDNPSL